MMAPKISESIEQIGGYRVHPVAAMFPLLEGGFYEEFKGNIEKYGQIEPIVIQGDMLIDGRNRLRACLDLGVEPRTKEYDFDLLPARYIIAKNLERRDLTEDQRVAVAAQARGWITADLARQRKLAGKSADGQAGGRGKKKNLVQESGQGLRAPRTVDEVAAEAKTSRYKAEQAMRVVQDAPEEAAAVIAGKQSLRAAVKKAAGKTLKAKGQKHSNYLDEKTRFLHRLRSLMGKYPHRHDDLRDAIVLTIREVMKHAAN
jgi:ParB-like chromosome segregation protein Spo0J